MEKKGILISAMGLPSVGKSSVIKELGKLLGCKTFLEPEESYWGRAIRDREINTIHPSNYFTGNMFFRSMRVPYYFEAQRLVLKGELVLLDTFYDKLTYLYMDDKENFNWLFDHTNDYYQCLKDIARLDYITLPDADYLIFIDIDEKDWKKFLKRRGRDLDKNNDFLKSFNGKETIKKAIKQYSEELKKKNKNLVVIETKQRYDSANTIAMEIFCKLYSSSSEIQKYLKDNDKLNFNIDDYCTKYNK